MKKNFLSMLLSTHFKKIPISLKSVLTSIFTHLKVNSRRIFFLRIRLLPVVIFCSGLLLTVKISFLWKNLHPDEEIWGIAESYAEKPSAGKSQNRETPKKAKAESKNPTATSENIPVQNVDVTEVDPSVLTREQFKVLLELSQRQKELEKQQKKIPKEEATLSVIEQQIKDHTSELQKTKKRLEDLLNQVEEKENGNTARLVKMAESMKPKEAARILETLDFTVLLEIMEKIKPKSGSAILSSMDPVKAGYLMTELAKRRKLIKRDESF